MSTSTNEAGTRGIVARIRIVGWGTSDTRVRATWRVLLAMPLLWILTGAVLTGNVQSAIEMIPSGGATGAGLAQSLLHAGFFLVALIVWARYLDRRSLRDYGISASVGWVADGFVGVTAVLVGSAVWTGTTSILGGTSIVVAPSIPEEPLVGLVFSFVALLLHAAVQQVVFFRVILENAAEGLHSRGFSAHWAAVTAVPVAVLFFILMHGSVTVLRILDLAVAGSIFGLLYLHTGELALGIGAHFGALFGRTVIRTFIAETGSVSGYLGILDQYGFPMMVIAYGLLVVWLEWSGDLQIQSAIARLPTTPQSATHD